MTANTDQNQAEVAKVSDKELNFRALEAKYQRQLDQERAARVQVERQFQESQEKKNQIAEDEDDTNDPYVDNKKLEKKMLSFEKRMEAKIEQKAEEKARSMLEEGRKEQYLRSNPDFFDVLQHADKFAEQDPELAETILRMPEGFDRQKLVFQTIKNLGIHRGHVEKSSIQEKIDANRKSPFYQPSGTATAPYASTGDFSAIGQANAYKKMKELQSKLRM